MTTITIKTQLNHNHTPEHIEINGAWVDTDYTNVRNPSEARWYDRNHQRVMSAIHMLEDALEILFQADADACAKNVTPCSSRRESDDNVCAHYPFNETDCDHSCGYELDHSDNTRHCYNCGEPHPNNPQET